MTHAVCKADVDKAPLVDEEAGAQTLGTQLRARVAVRLVTGMGERIYVCV